MGGIFVSYSLTDGDGDTASAISAAPISVTIEDDGIAVDVAQATNGEDSESFVTLGTLVLDELIQSDRGPDSNGDGANDDNHPIVTTPSYITTATSTLAIGITSTPTTVSGSGTSIADLFTVTKTIGSDGLENENKVYSLTLTDANGDPVLSPETGVLTNLHVTDTGGSPVAGSSEDHRAIYLYQVSATEIDGLIGHDTGDASDDFVALRIFLTGDPADPVLQVEQYLPLEHPLTGSDHFDELVCEFCDHRGKSAMAPASALQLTDTVTDGDGDTATGSQTVTIATAGDSETSSGTSLITFEDDGPGITSAFSSGTVVQDETAGVQTTSDPNAQNDVAGSGLPSGVLALFNAITNKGVDPDVNPKDNNAIGFATSSSPIIFATADFGTDGPAVTNSKVLALAINGGDGADSGLQTTDGHEIFLFKEGSLIVGRYDGDSSGTVVNSLSRRLIRRRLPSRSARTATSALPNTSR